MYFRSGKADSAVREIYNHSQKGLFVHIEALFIK